MKEEVLAAVEFLIHFIEKSDFPREQLQKFKDILTSLLMKRFEKHWFPEIPARGQGYRCIRMNTLTPIDESIEMAANRCGFSYKDLSLPTELTLWVDPSEVCYRLGESEGSYCTLATFPSYDTSSEGSWSTSSTPASSPPGSPVHDGSLCSSPIISRTTTASAAFLLQHQQQQQQRIGGGDHSFLRYQQQHMSHHHQHCANPSFVTSSPNVVSLPPTSHSRKPLARDISFNNYQNQRLHWRCELTAMPMPPNASVNLFRNYNNGYNNRQYKNVVKV